MVDRPPKVVNFTVDLHEHLVQMPPPMAGPHTFNPPFADFGGENRTEAMSPVPNRFVADIDTAFMKQVLDVPQ